MKGAAVLAVLLSVGVARLHLAAAAVSVIQLYRNDPQLDPLATRSAGNMVYYGVFDLGTPGKQFTGCFDTGSADTWVPSSICMNPSCLTHDRYSSFSSSSFQPTGKTFTIQYGTGNVAGTVGQDTLTMGTPPITIPHQGFGQVLSSSSTFLSTSCDGLFGLGFPQLSNTKTIPAFFNMLEEGVLDNPQFSIWLAPDLAREPAGELMFGNYDTSKFSGPLVWMPVVEKLYWTVALDGAAVNGQTLALGATQAILDSGTTAILVSDADASAINKAIPGLKYNDGGYYEVVGGCAAVSSLPAITFILNNQPFAVPAAQWTQPTATDPAQQDGNCMSAVLGGGDKKSVILGGNFLRAFYSVYMYDMASKNAQVGLAPAINVPITAAAS